MATRYISTLRVYYTAIDRLAYVRQTANICIRYSTVIRGLEWQLDLQGFVLVLRHQLRYCLSARFLDSRVNSANL